MPRRSLGNLGLLLGKHLVVETGAQHLHRLCLVLVLRLLVLALNDEVLVGRCVMRTADCVVLTLCPPGPDEQKTSIRSSFSSMSTSTSSASGRTATVTAEVWIAPLGLGLGHTLHAVHATFVLQSAVDPLALDHRDDFLDAA